MAKKTVKLPSISRVVAGAIAILELPLNPTYHNILLTLTGTSLSISDIERIRVIANGKTVQEFKNLQRLIDVNKYHGRKEDTANEFMIHFKDDDFNDLSAKRVPAFGTANLQTFNVEIELAAAAPADIVMKAFAYIDTNPEPLGIFTKIQESSISSAVAGEIEYDKLARNDAIYKQVHFFKADISNIEFEADSHTIIDATKQVLERLQRGVLPVPRIPQGTKATHIDFMLEGDDGDMLNTNGVQDLRVKLEFDTAGVCEIVTEQFALFQG